MRGRGWEKAVKERELGNMQIAGEKIRILETQDPEDQWGAAWQNNTKIPFFRQIQWPGFLVARWQAFNSAGYAIAEAFLFDCGQGTEVVGFTAEVVEASRNIGLGRFMIRLATDQAIRYRKRTILTEVENSNAAALHILDIEDFEKQPDVHPGFTFLKKELKWI